MWGSLYMGIRKTKTTVTQNRYYIRRWSQTGAIDFRPLAHAHSLLTSNRWWGTSRRHYDISVWPAVFLFNEHYIIAISSIPIKQAMILYELLFVPLIIIIQGQDKGITFTGLYFILKHLQQPPAPLEPLHDDDDDEPVRHKRKTAAGCAKVYIPIDIVVIKPHNHTRTRDYLINQCWQTPAT